MPSPAPWSLDWSPLGFGAISDADSQIIAFVQAPVGMDSERAAADARLMAAAPQLIAALKDIEMMSEGTTYDIVASIHRIAFDAIRKAKRSCCLA